jgi:hypothetical protein
LQLAALLHFVAQPPPLGCAVHGHGHYRETYRKVGGEWRFASVHLTRIRVVITPANQNLQ